MKVSFNWLKDYVDIGQSPQELANSLTESGLEVEELTPRIQPFQGVVVGRVISVKQHPNANKLSVCEVISSEKEEPVQVICGAPNVAEGQYVPFAQNGANLPNGFKIKKVKIRGVESNGMICSREELGLDQTSHGIWAFKDAPPLGVDVYEMLAENQDYILDIAVTPNRPDCLSIIGVAREIAAINKQTLRKPDVNVKEDSTESIDHYAAVHIHDTDGCHRYAARVIRNVKIGESPQWMREKLEAVGLRPINNIVDITNFVLMETGHPLHAFDLREIKGNEIHVRASKKGQTFITLDDKERTLPDETVMIYDGERPIAIGGIMGGQNSEVDFETKDILLESAYFKPQRIAASSKRLGLCSEASQRFERGADIEGVISALNRATELLETYAEGQTVRGIADNYPSVHDPVKVAFDPDHVNRLLGTDLDHQTIIDTLKRLELIYREGYVHVPSFRVDIRQSVDLIEEVARLVHYSNLPTKKTTEIIYEDTQPRPEYVLDIFREKLVELGLNEAYTNSMIKASEAEPFVQGREVTILNPISDDMTTMRPSLLPGLLKSLSYNLNRQMRNVRLFELGRIFVNYRENQLPDQPYALSAVLTGQRRYPAWDGSEQPIDFYDLKGILEQLFEKIFLDKIQFILYDDFKVFSKHETIAVKVNGEFVGLCGLLNTDICSRFDIEKPVYALELNADLLMKATHFKRHYKPVSRYPVSERDMALVMDNETPAADVLQFVKKSGGELLQDVFIFDVYSGEHIPEGKKSLAIRMRFQAFDRTLNDEEVDRIFDRIIEESKNKFSATLRD